MLYQFSQHPVDISLRHQFLQIVLDEIYRLVIFPHRDFENWARCDISKISAFLTEWRGYVSVHPSMCDVLHDHITDIEAACGTRKALRRKDTFVETFV